MIDYKNSKNKRFRYIFVVIDKFFTYTWCSPLKNKYSETITKEISNTLTKSKRNPFKIESDRGGEFYNSLFYNFIIQNFLKSKNIQHYSRFTDEGPSVAERVIRTIRNLLKKPVFEKGNADWLSELPSVISRYDKTIHNSTKMAPIQAKKSK